MRMNGRRRRCGARCTAILRDAGYGISRENYCGPRNAVVVAFSLIINCVCCVVRRTIHSNGKCMNLPRWMVIEQLSEPFVHYLHELAAISVSQQHVQLRTKPEFLALRGIRPAHTFYLTALAGILPVVDYPERMEKRLTACI